MRRKRDAAPRVPRLALALQEACRLLDVAADAVAARATEDDARRDSVARALVAAHSLANPPRTLPVVALRTKRLAREFLAAVLGAMRYGLRSPLGRGSYGEVFRADDLLDEARDVAVKVASPHLLDAHGDERHDVALELEKSRAEYMLQCEYQLLMQLNTLPGILRVHEYFPPTAGAPAQYVMELCPTTLEAACTFDLIDRRARRRILLEVLDALRVLHGLHIHHRDLRAANVLLRSDGTAVLADFGASRAGIDRMETPGFSTPSVDRPNHQPGDERSPAIDVKAFGLLALRLMTDEKAWQVYRQLVASESHDGDVIRHVVRDMRTLRPHWCCGDHGRALVLDAMGLGASGEPQPLEDLRPRLAAIFQARH